MDETDVVVSALAEPTRRRVVELLAESPRRTSELAALLESTVPAVSRHLRVLRDKGLVERSDVEGDGRGRSYQLTPDRQAALANWLRASRWADRLSEIATEPESAEFLARVGRFLDAFATTDVAFFEKHLAPDVQLIFPGSPQRWNKEATVASVEDHPPYVEWSISDSSTQTLAAGLTLVTVTALVRTEAAAEPGPVVQSMVFDDSTDPWTLRFLQQSPAIAS